MKKTKQFLRPLLMAIVMLVGMLVPQGAWAQELEVDGETIISSDASYDEIYVYPGGELIINEGVTLTVTSELYINGDPNENGTVINYGTIIGEGYINMMGGVLANHGHIDLGGANGYGTFYNTGTLGEYIYLTPTEECNHAEYEDLGTVEATCTHGAGTQYRCKTCYYMRLDETSGALPHSINSHNGMNICSSCGHTTYDEPANGNGSEEDPYQIANAGNLYWFADYTRIYNYANAILTADIVLNDGTFATDGTFTATGADEPSKPFPWICIGGVNGSYGGTFDGNGHTISGMYVNDSFGLFYDLSGSVVNLGIVNCYIRVYDYTGAICHWNKGTISNCYTTGILSGSYSSGICDTNTDIYSTISNCYSTCTFVYDSYFYGGGICGTNSGTISNCYTSDNTTIQYNNATASEVYGGVSANRFASGEIAYKLNGSIDGEGSWTAGATDGTQAWYQKLGENGDSYPVLAAAEGNTVYYGYENCLSESETYSNDLRYAEMEDAHDYHVQLNENEKPVFVWSEDYTTATLQVVCSHNADHTANVEVTGEDITSEDTTPATCITTGVRTYTATATYEGEEYTGTKNEKIPQIPHDFTSHTLTDGPVTSGLYAYTCDYGCWHYDEHRFIKDFYGEGNHLELTEDGAGNYSTSEDIILADANGFAAPIDFIANSVTYTRTGIKNQWGTIVVPFDINGIGADYDLYKLNQVSDFDEQLVLTKIDENDNGGIVPAGTPVIFRLHDNLAGDYTLTLTAANTTVSCWLEEGSDADGFQIVGTYETIRLNEYDYYISKNMFWMVGDVWAEGVKVAPFRAYIHPTWAGAKARTLSIRIADEDVTAVDALNALTEGNAEYYDTNGRRTNSLQKGVNIVKYGNGKTLKVNIK